MKKLHTAAVISNRPRTIELLAALPAEQRNRLAEHVMAGNLKQLRYEINELKINNAWQELADHIAELVERYDLDGLQQLLITEASTIESDIELSNGRSGENDL